jgi:hypothetical protein
MEKRQVGSFEVKAQRQNDGSTAFRIGPRFRQVVIWNGRWIDSNRGVNYCGYRYREEILKAFELI